MSPTATRGARRLGVSIPRACLLSHGDYSVLVGAAGTGGSWLGSVALTAWNADPVEDRDGVFVYLRDLASGALWSAGHQPVRHPAERYAAAWHPGRFEIERLDHGIEARLETFVVPGASLEVRRLSLTNHSARARRIEATSYAEVVLQPAAAHASHPEFSRLFVQTEFVPEPATLLARRRPRSPDERHPWLLHAIVEGGPVEHETDRARFVTRGRTLAAPHALVCPPPLSGATGNVLDPILSLRRVIELEPGAMGRVTFLIGAAPGRAAALALAERWSSAPLLDEALGESERLDREILERSGVSEERAADLQALAVALIVGPPGLGSGGEVAASGPDLERLARYGIDPGRPLVVVHAGTDENAGRLGRWVRAYRYWRAIGVPCELLVLGDDPRRFGEPLLPRPDESHRVLVYGQIDPTDLGRIDAAARLLIPAEPFEALLVESPAALGSAGAPGGNGASFPAPRGAVVGGTTFDEPLRHFNGHGGFSADGSEYVIRLEHRPGEGLSRPPRPWINVIANPTFGCLVSETGAGPTWSQNSREHRLTPWSNDPLLDPHGEALYLRDDDSGELWSPLPGPLPAPADYEMRHGFGSSTCRHASGGLEQETCVFVSRHDPLKVVRVRLTNHGGPRRLSLFAYQRLVLGTRPEETARAIVTEWEAGSWALLARRQGVGALGARVAFAGLVCDRPATVSFTADRESFIGRHGAPDHPAAPRSPAPLDGRCGAGLDPCFATQAAVTLGRGETLECSVLLGDAESREEALALIERHRAPGAIAAALAEARGFWRELLAGVSIETPVPALDLMVNGWLAYQNLSCRMWGRTALYQSGGAFGYRDQLQDAAALAWLWPERTREQILLHAAHQFAEGDVLHWWHPPMEQGLRTRFADDRLWLPYVTADYVRATGDAAILEQRAPFLTARPLDPGEDEAYLAPRPAGADGDLYDHCCRAIDRSLEVGAHGLPRFGTGDWNDGMNRVGREGRGESVWMAFFLGAVLDGFAPLCERRGDGARAARYRAHRARLAAAVEAGAWDGEWYLRGFYDDGAPLGSKHSDECRIDALAQAWSVISGLVSRERASTAMDSVERHLVSEADGLIRLLTPPFERTAHDPGYIRGYVPGVRENGGQYTHAALWVVRALAELGRRDRAARLLEMLTPVHHAASAADVARYQVEPYVVAADVYGEAPHVGRGGWTWYTGSAGWMTRVALESVLGITLEGGDTVRIRPCVPAEWPGFRVRLRMPVGGAAVEIRVVQRAGGAGQVVEARLDGAASGLVEGAARVTLPDAEAHTIEVILG